MENETYQRIFNAFNACGATAQKSSSAQDFKVFVATPESMLQTLATVRSVGTPQQFQIHKTSYLRALMTALRNDSWNQTHAQDLINATDWLVSLRDKSHHSTNYIRQLRILVASVQQKVSVPEEKQQEWAKVTAPKKKPYIPDLHVGMPVECYGRGYKVSHVQSFSADDRN